MTVSELHKHFLDRAEWVDQSNTADLLEYGDPGKTVKRIGVGWSACLPNLRAAANDGCDLFITHEPSFCEFWNPELRFRESSWGHARADLLEQHGMAMFALHDSWDFWPQHGIVDSWAAHLGLTSPPVVREVYRYQLNPAIASPVPMLAVHEVPATTFDKFAAHVSDRVQEFGMHGVMVMGNGEATVRRVAVGGGCGIPSFELIGRADVFIQVFDRAFQTITRIPMVELDANLIVVEHSVSEMPGMRNLARYIGTTFPGIKASFYCNEPQSRFV
jgi:putative NIF3 family GTP cyclohydrolase 1 type 2